MLHQGLAFSPQQKIFGEQLLSDSLPSVVLEQELDNLYTDFCVGWLAEHWSGGCRTCSYSPCYSVFPIYLVSIRTVMYFPTYASDL